MNLRVAAFQMEHNDFEGKPLVVDGDLGCRTHWAMQVEALPEPRRGVVRRAVRHVGLVEHTGNNDHPIIDFFHAWCMSPGGPWCAVFASWCIGQSEYISASAQALGRMWPSTGVPLPADLMWYPTGPWQGHCGIVVAVGPTHVLCAEGNRNNGLRLVKRRRREVKFANTFGKQYCVVNIPIGFEETRTAQVLRGTR